MSEVLLSVFAGLAAALGMTWFALSLPAHWAQVQEEDISTLSPAQCRRLRLAGALMLAAAFALCLVVDHASMAVLVWSMLLAVAAVGVALVLAHRPTCLRRLAFFV